MLSPVRLSLSVILVLLLAACGGAPAIPEAPQGDQAGQYDDPPADEQPDGGNEEDATGRKWPGFISRVEVFDGEMDGDHVTMRREERWENFVVTTGEVDGSIAFFEADWSVREWGVRSGSGCVTRTEGQGHATYPWFTFDVNPMDEVSYELYSTGTGGGPGAPATTTAVCENQETTTLTLPDGAGATWLPGAGFELPADLQPPGYQPPDRSLYGPTVHGKIDPAHPDVIAGTSRGQVGGEGPMITLTWNLLRNTSDCEDLSDLVNSLVDRESTVMDAADYGADGEGGRLGSGASVAAPRILADGSLSAATVGETLSGVLGADQVSLRQATGNDSGGLQPFAVRLSEDGRILPSLDALKGMVDSTCAPPGSIEGAPRLLIGSVQWSGDGFRVNLRTVNTETAEVLDSVSDRGQGGPDELRMALQNGLLGLLEG
jgi:hypothetical protein